MGFMVGILVGSVEEKPSMEGQRERDYLRLKGGYFERSSMHLIHIFSGPARASPRWIMPMLKLYTFHLPVISGTKCFTFCA